MTADMPRTPLQHTPRLQFLPLQVPQPPLDHPGGIVKEMSATGMAIAAVRIFHQFHWAFCIPRSTGMHHFLAFISLLYPSLGIPGCLDQKIALDPIAHTWNQTII
jgi:hypothetical protein